MKFSWETNETEEPQDTTQGVRVSLQPFSDLRSRVSAVMSDGARWLAGCVDKLTDGKGTEVTKEEYLDMLSSLLREVEGSTFGVDSRDALDGYFARFKREAVAAFREANGQPTYSIREWDYVLEDRYTLFDKLLGEVMYLPNATVSREWFYAMYHMVKQLPYPEDLMVRFEDATADAIYESTVEEIGANSPLFGVFAGQMTLDEALTMLGAPTDICGKSPDTLEFRVEWRRLVQALAGRFEQEFGYNPLEKQESTPFGGESDWGFGGGCLGDTSPFTQTQSPFGSTAQSNPFRGGYLGETSPFTKTQSPFGSTAQSNPFSSSTRGAFGSTAQSNPFSAQSSMAFSPRSKRKSFLNFGNARPNFTFLGAHFF